MDLSKTCHTFIYSIRSGWCFFNTCSFNRSKLSSKKTKHVTKHETDVPPPPPPSPPPFKCACMERYILHILRYYDLLRILLFWRYRSLLKKLMLIIFCLFEYIVFLKQIAILCCHINKMQCKH